MNAEIKARWIEALRSGKYTQGRGYLRSINDQFCCLGVLCDVAMPDEWRLQHPKAHEWQHLNMPAYPSIVLKTYAAIDHKACKHLASMNDGPKLSFNEIADWIEQNL